MNKTANNLDKMTEILSYVSNDNKERVSEILVSITLDEYIRGWHKGRENKD